MEFKKELVHPELLDAEILKQKKNYLDMIVNEFSTPMMKEACENAMKDATFEGNKDRAEAMKKTIDQHDKNLAAFAEAKSFTEKTIVFLESIKA